MFTFLLCCSPAVAADYTPPPLFGAPSTVVPAPAPAPQKITPTYYSSSPRATPSAPVNVNNTKDLDAAASVAERVAQPIQQAAPISTEILLNHPADRIAGNAQDAMTAKAAQDSQGIPDLVGYDDDASATLPIPQKTKPNTQIPTRASPSVRVTSSHTADDLFADLPPVAATPELSTSLLGAGDTSVDAGHQAPPLPLVTRGTQNSAAPIQNRTGAHTLVPFKGHLTDLTIDQKNTLDDHVIARLNNSPTMRVGIDAFATPDDAGDGSDRRISLARGLAVRSYLMEKGIESARIDVRALGKNTTQAPLERVDVVFK